ncbi:hypothetical protein COOONC_04543 [Cooperia oncophora]
MTARSDVKAQRLAISSCQASQGTYGNRATIRKSRKCRHRQKVRVLFRRRRDIKDDILDEDAATAIFGSEGEEPKLHRHPIGPPAPPTQAEYRRQMQVIASGQDHEMQFSPALFERERALPPTTNVVPYDINVDPNFPVEAPRARPIVDEFSTNRVDEEFRTGYRWRSVRI